MLTIEESLMVYEDCIVNCITTSNPLPQWYLLLEKAKEEVFVYSIYGVGWTTALYGIFNRIATYLKIRI